MSKEQTLTVAELKSLILAGFNADHIRQAKLQARLQQELGNKIQEEDPKTIAINNKLMDEICSILARRLKQNRRTTPLLSPRDIVKFASLMINEIVETEGEELKVEDRKKLDKYIKGVFENILDMVHPIVPSRKNSYDEYWRWITTVLNLAAERGILSTELLALEEATDEITRRMFTKKQLIALFKRAENKSMDADALKKIIINPMLDVFAEGDEEELRELGQALEAKLMPQLRETVEKSKVIIGIWLGEEVERIYTRKQ